MTRVSTRKIHLRPLQLVWGPHITCRRAAPRVGKGFCGEHIAFRVSGGKFSLREQSKKREEGGDESYKETAFRGNQINLS